MKKEEILDGNRLIVEFMDENYKKEYAIVNFMERPSHKETCNSFEIEELEYYSSWDWLMPVVEKIEKIQLPSPSLVPVRIEISGNACRLFKGTWGESKEGFIAYVSYSGNKEQYTKISATWNCIVYFIKWYNQQKHK